MSKITLSRFWDLGEEETIHPSRSKLYNILNALILCGGKMHNSHSSDIENHEWKDPERECSVVFRISLPIGTEEKFEELSGCKLSQPDNVVGS